MNAPEPMAPAVPHGADLHRAIARYGQAPGGRPWMDLSTGIHPLGWPVSRVLADLDPVEWRNLPTPGERDLQALAVHYGPGAWPVAGSQAVIQSLPRVWRRLHGTAQVHVLSPGYGEHAARWSLEGHEVLRVRRERLAPADVIVLASPNNPTGEGFTVDELTRLAHQCRLLVVDLAFAEAQAAGDAVAQALAAFDNVVVLRSIGKFYGLAGLRFGVVLAPAPWLASLKHDLGPWAVPGPVLRIALAALADIAWQREARHWLAHQSEALARVLQGHGLASVGTPLFRTVETPHAVRWHEGLARRGIWTRLFDLDATAGGGVPYRALRLGLPPDDAALHRLADALVTLTLEIPA